jgi:hypothetical protein
MQYLQECQDILEQLKLDYPIPETCRLFVEWQDSEFAKIAGRGRGVGRTFQFLPGRAPFQQAKIAVAMRAKPSTLRDRLDTVAHEYRHVYQGQVMHLRGAKRVTEADACAFAASYTEEYMTKKCMT